MLAISILDKGKVRRIPVKQAPTARQFSWIHSEKPTKEDFALIDKKTSLTKRDIAYCTDEDEIPRIADLEGGTMIIFKAPYQEQGHISTTSFSVILAKDTIITVCKNPIESVAKIFNLPDKELETLMGKGRIAVLHEILYRVIASYSRIMLELEDRIDDMETKVIKAPTRELVEEIFDAKKTLIFFNKALVADREVISGIEKGYIRELRTAEVRMFRDLYHELIQLIDTVGTYRDILTSTLDMYISSISNNLNEVMKRLTGITALLLVPTLIAGIYGMNFHPTSPWNMPELQWIYGYPFALGLMLVSMILLLWFFRRQRWI